MINNLLSALEEKALYGHSELAVDIVERALTRYGSAQSLIANIREPRVIRRCLAQDNKRLIRQIITGHVCSIR